LACKLDYMNGSKSFPYRGLSRYSKLVHAVNHISDDMRRHSRPLQMLVFQLLALSDQLLQARDLIHADFL